MPAFAAEEKAAAPEADAVPAEGKAQPAAGGEAKEAPKVKPWLIWFLESSGLIGLFILILSIYFVATVCRQFWELRLEVAVPPDVVSRAQELLQQKDFKSIFKLVKEDDDSFFSRLVSTGIGELPNGLAEARDVMERTAESATVDMEKKISILAVLGTLGPMIGLLGTLKGMIASFSVIARSDVQMKASEVAGGISEALLLTFEGVALSVPAIYFFSLFRNRVSSISTTAALEADQFLRHFAHAARAKGQAGGATATKVAQKTE
jgi:biopolymer transport protein ExbB